MAAKAEGTKGEISGQRTRFPEHVEFVPSSAWTEDSKGHYLLVNLPEFKKEEVRLQVDDSGNITVSGERMVNSNKYLVFEQTYKMPENSDIDNVSGNFDGEILHVRVPKLQVVEENNDNDESDHQSDIAEEDNTVGHQDPGDQECRGKAGEMEKKKKRLSSGILKKWGKDVLAASAPLERAMKMIKRNKAILFTAVIALLLGVLVTLSRNRLESAGA